MIDRKIIALVAPSLHLGLVSFSFPLRACVRVFGVEPFSKHGLMHRSGCQEAFDLSKGGLLSSLELLLNRFAV